MNWDQGYIWSRYYHGNGTYSICLGDSIINCQDITALQNYSSELMASIGIK